MLTLLRELESQSFVVLYSLSRGPILCGPVRSFAVFPEVLCDPVRSFAVFSITLLPPFFCLLIQITKSLRNRQQATDN